MLTVGSAFLQIHRHGEREAIFDFPKPGQAVTALAGSLSTFPKEAQLTAKGVEQMYDYGRFMRQRYHRYLEDDKVASSRRIKVISSGTDRTINRLVGFVYFEGSNISISSNHRHI